jgi:hypothetical protein
MTQNKSFQDYSPEVQNEAIYFFERLAQGKRLPTPNYGNETMQALAIIGRESGYDKRGEKTTFDYLSVVDPQAKEKYYPGIRSVQNTVVIDGQGYSVAPELQQKFIEQKTQEKNNAPSVSSTIRSQIEMPQKLMAQNRSSSISSTITSQIEQQPKSIQPDKGYIDTKNRPGVPGLLSSAWSAGVTGLKDVGIGLGIVKGDYKNPLDYFENKGTAKADKTINSNINPTWRGTISNQNIPGYYDTSNITYGQLEQRRLMESGVSFDLVGVPENVRVSRTIERTGKATSESAQKEYDALSQSIFEQKQIDVYGGKDINIAQSEYESESTALKSRVEEKYNKQFDILATEEVRKVRSASASADITGGRLGVTTGDTIKRVTPEVIKTGLIVAGSLSASPLVFGAAAVVSGGILATQSFGKAFGNEDITTGERIKLIGQGAIGLGIIGFGVSRSVGLNRESLLSKQYESELRYDLEKETIRLSGNEVYKSDKGAVYLLRGERSVGSASQETTFTLKTFRNVKPDVFAKSESGIPTLISKGKEQVNSVITGGKTKTTIYNFLSGETKTSINKFGAGSRPVTTAKSLSKGGVTNILSEGELSISEGYVKIKDVPGFKKSYSFSLVKEDEEVYKVAAGKLSKARLSSSGKMSATGKFKILGTIKKLKVDKADDIFSSGKAASGKSNLLQSQKTSFNLGNIDEVLTSDIKATNLQSFQKSSLVPATQEALPGPDAIAKGIQDKSFYYGKGSMQLEEQSYGVLQVNNPIQRSSTSQRITTSGGGSGLVLPSQINRQLPNLIVTPSETSVEKGSLINRPRLRSITNQINNVFQTPAYSSIQVQGQQQRLSQITKLKAPMQNMPGFDFNFDYGLRFEPPRGKLRGKLNFDNPLLEAESFGRSKRSRRKYGYTASLSASVLGIKGKPMSIGSDAFGKLYGAGIRPIPIYSTKSRKTRKHKY